MQNLRENYIDPQEDIIYTLGIMMIALTQDNGQVITILYKCKTHITYVFQAKIQNYAINIENEITQRYYVVQVFSES